MTTTTPKPTSGADSSGNDPAAKPTADPEVVADLDPADVDQILGGSCEPSVKTTHAG